MSSPPSRQVSRTTLPNKVAPARSRIESYTNRYSDPDTTSRIGLKTPPLYDAAALHNNEDELNLDKYSIDAQTRLVLQKIESRLRRQVAASNVLLRDYIRNLEIRIHDGSISLESLRQRVSQTNFILREEIQQVQQSVQEEAVEISRSVHSHNQSTMADALAIVEDRVSSRTDNLQTLVYDTINKVNTLADRFGKNKTFDGATARLIAQHVASALDRTTSGLVELYDEYGNINDESLFVKELEKTLMTCIEPFLPPIHNGDEDMRQNTW